MTEAEKVYLCGMKQIDLEPTGYRKQDRETGRWVQNINKPLCRWMAIGAGAFALYFAFASGEEIGVTGTIACMAFAAGGLFILSLKSTDW